MSGFLGSITGQVRLDIRQAVAAYATVRAQNARTVYALRGTGDSLVSSGKTMATAGAGMVYAFAKVVNASAEFERKMDYAGAVSGATGKKLQELSDYALKLGQDTIYSAGEIADGFIELAKAGVDTEKIIGGIGKAMTDLGAAADIPFDQAGQIVTSTVAQFDLDIRKAAHVVDIIAGAANASIADVSDIGTSLKYVGGVAAAAGLKFDDTATAISLLAKAGIRGSTAGTSLRQIITSLGGATEAATGQLEELGIITEDGSNKFFDAQGRVKSLADVFQTLQNAVQSKKLNPKEQLAAFKTIFNQRALSAVSILTRQGAKGFDEMYAAMSKVKAADVAHQRLDNLSGDIEILRGNIETYITKAGQPFQESLRGMVQGLTKLVQWFGKLSPETQKNIIAFVGIAGAALAVMGVFNIILGSIFKFAAHLLKLGAGLKFVGKMFGLAWRAIKAFDIAGLVRAAFIGLGPILGAISLPVLAVVAAIAALVAGFVIAYKKSEAFRNAVQAVIDTLKSGAKIVGKWVKLLFQDPGKAMDQLKSATKLYFTKVLPQQVQAARDTVVRVWRNLWQSAKQFVRNAARDIKGIISRMMVFIGEVFTMENMKTAWDTELTAIKTGTQNWANTMKGIFADLANSLPGLLNNGMYRAGQVVGFGLARIVVTATKLGQRLVSTMTSVGSRMASGFATGASGVTRAFLKMTFGVMSAMFEMQSRVSRLARNIVSGLERDMGGLPKSIPDLFLKMGTLAIKYMNRLPGVARTVALRVVSNFLSALGGLPGEVVKVLARVAQAFIDAASNLAAAALRAAQGIVSGFRAGLGGGGGGGGKGSGGGTSGKGGGSVPRSREVTPSRTLAGQAKTFDGLAKRLLNDTMGLNAPQGVPNALSNRSTNRIAAAIDPGSTRNQPVKINLKGGGPQVVTGALRLADGRAYISGIAEQVYDSNSKTDGRRDRMNK